VSFDSRRIPVAGADREVIARRSADLGRTFRFTAATIGNPHCVIPVDELSADLARRYGPALEVHPLFPNRTNVQFLKVLDRNNIQIEIWERGAGLHARLGEQLERRGRRGPPPGLVDRSVTVRMPGGSIGIEIGDGFAITMTGTVNRVADGEIHPELFDVTEA
jgi:diaminopimelate epimerase